MKLAEYENIYKCIVSMADYLANSCKVLCELIDSIDDSENIIKRIHLIEDDADQAFHDFRYVISNNKLTENKDAIKLINIVSAIEACIDDIDELATDFYRYNITELKDNVITSIINLERASTHLMEIVILIKKNENPNSSFKAVIELDHYKVEANKLYNLNMNKLFATEKDPIEIIKWQAIYSSVLSAFEDFEDIAECFGKMLFNW